MAASKIKKGDVRATAEIMADALVRLNMFYAIIALCESGMFPGGDGNSQETEFKIIELCKEEAQRQLGIHDEARAHLSDLERADG